MYILSELCWEREKGLSAAACAHLTDRQPLPPSPTAAALSSSWIPAWGIPAAWRSSRSRRKSTRRVQQTWEPSWAVESRVGEADGEGGLVAYIHSGSYDHLPDCIHLFRVHFPKEIWVLLVEGHQGVNCLWRNHFAVTMTACTALVLSQCYLVLISKITLHTLDVLTRM